MPKLLRLRPRTLCATVAIPRALLRLRPRFERTRHGFALDLRPTVADDVRLFYAILEAQRRQVGA